MSGRVGNLTAEEENKLQELWGLMLQVTGVATSPTPNGKQSPALSRQQSASDATPEKKKKSRLSFLKKKNKHDENEAPSTTSSSPASCGLNVRIVMNMC